MRVIAGTARRLQLKTLDGFETRPTTDRIKETLFNMLTPYLYDCIFLDLFAGSGGIGIEALSRGAMKAYFVDNNPNAIVCIKENLKHTRLFQKGETMPVDVLTALKRLEGNQQFDFIFMDPPYGKGLEREVLGCLLDSSLLTEDTTIILEAALNEETDWIENLGYHIRKVKKYKTNKHLFIEMDEEDE